MGLAESGHPDQPVASLRALAAACVYTTVPRTPESRSTIFNTLAPSGLCVVTDGKGTQRPPGGRRVHRNVTSRFSSPKLFESIAPRSALFE
jgi:hypothetical protein